MKIPFQLNNEYNLQVCRLYVHVCTCPLFEQRIQRDWHYKYVQFFLIIAIYWRKFCMFCDRYMYMYTTFISPLTKHHDVQYMYYSLVNIYMYSTVLIIVHIHVNKCAMFTITCSHFMFFSLYHIDHLWTISHSSSLK